MAAVATMGATPQVVDLSKLGLEQLTALKNQLDQELQLFTDSLQQLKIAQVKFNESMECVERLNPSLKDEELLVPLTSCMYIPGKIADPENLLIDIGTGYYVEKNRPDAKSYFDRKIKLVTEQMEKIQKIAAEKSRLREVVMDMMEIKVNQQLQVLQAQQGQGQATKT